MNKNILFFTTALTYGGTEKVMTYYVNYLLERGYAVTVLSMFNVTEVPTLAQEFSEHATLSYLSTPHIGNSFYNLVQQYNKGRAEKIKYASFRTVLNSYYSFKFKRFIRESNFDTLISFDSGLPNYILNTEKRKIIWCHFSLDHLFANFFKNYRINKWINDLRRYDAVVTISSSMTKQLEAFGLRNLTQIYNPTDNAIFQKSEQPVSSLKGLEDGSYIVTVSRLEENQKDVTGLIKSVYFLKQNLNFICKLVVVGDGRDRNNLEHLVEELALKSQVYFTGNQTNPYPLVLKSKLFVLSSKFEGLPGVLLEALMLDKLIIASDCPTGPREILAKDELLVKVGDVKEMAEKIFNLLTNTALQNDVKDHLRRQKSIFLPQNSYDKFEELLQSQLNICN